MNSRSSATAESVTISNLLNSIFINAHAKFAFYGESVLSI